MVMKQENMSQAAKKKRMMMNYPMLQKRMNRMLKCLKRSQQKRSQPRRAKKPVHTPHIRKLKH